MGAYRLEAKLWPLLALCWFFPFAVTAQTEPAHHQPIVVTLPQGPVTRIPSPDRRWMLGRNPGRNPRTTKPGDTRVNCTPFLGVSSNFRNKTGASPPPKTRPFRSPGSPGKANSESGTLARLPPPTHPSCSSSMLSRIGPAASPPTSAEFPPWENSHSAETDPPCDLLNAALLLRAFLGSQVGARLD